MTRPVVVRPNRRAFYNMKQGRGQTRRGYLRLVRALRKIILSADRPPVLGLIECNGNWSAIRLVARRYGYRIITGATTEGRSTALLVRKDVKVVASGTRSTFVHWQGPRGRVHVGRSIPWATVMLDGRVRTFAAVHMPWNRVKNKAAWDASVTAIRQLANQTVGELELMGDWNGDAIRLAAILGAYKVVTGDPLMFSLVRPAPDSPIRVIGDAKTNEGSDHPYAVNRDITRSAA